MSNNKPAPIKPANNQANMQNANKGFSGTNRQHAQNQGNRGKQMNPNQQPGKSGKQHLSSNARVSHPASRPPSLMLGEEKAAVKWRRQNT